MKTIDDLLTSWEQRSAGALPADAMLINRHIRELRETIQALAVTADTRTATTVVTSLITFAKSFVDNIDEWDGEPAPGMRWHREYLAAKSLLQQAGAAP